MKVKRITKLKVNAFDFEVVWDKAQSSGAGQLTYHPKPVITIGTKDNCESGIYVALCHELLELCAIEMNVRYNRPDIRDDYLFSLNHQQFETMSNMFAGLLKNFIGGK